MSEASITVVWGKTPRLVQGQSPWSGGQGAKPPEAETFLANLPTFKKLETQKIRYNLCCL